MSKVRRAKKLPVGFTDSEFLDLEVITILDGHSSKSDTIRQLIHKRKEEMYANENKTEAYEAEREKLRTLSEDA